MTFCRHRWFLAPRLILVLGVCSLTGRAWAEDRPAHDLSTESAELAKDVASSLGLSEVVAATIIPARVSGNVIAIDVPLPDGPVRLFLKPHSVRSPNYRLVVQGPGGTYEDREPGVEHTYRGVVEGIDGSAVAASIENGAVRALVLIPGRDRIWIEPSRGSVASLHAVYGDSAVTAGGRCGLTEHALNAADVVHLDSAAPAAPATQVVAGLPNETWFAELAIDSDVDFFDRFGSVAATEARINSIINTVNIQYERDVGIQHVISHMIIRTEFVSMYSSSSANSLLFQFSDFWFRFQGGVQRDTAHLFTGKSLSEGILGLANFSGLCDTREGYGLSGYNKRCNAGDNAGNTCRDDTQCPGGACVDAVCQSFACRTDVTAHELGHNWAAPHCPPPDFCQGWTMHPSIQGANRFHPDITVPRILSYLATVTSCLIQGDELIDLLLDPPTADVGGGNELQLSATADFLYGIDKDVTALAMWSIDRPEFATIDPTGLLVAGAVTTAEVVTVTATFTFDGMVQQATSAVTIQPAPFAPIADPDTPEKNRYISLVLPPVAGATALKVTFVTLQRPVPPNLGMFPPFNFAGAEGRSLWVGPPRVCADIASPNRDYMCAQLSCEPHYLDDWGDEVIHVAGAEIMPSSEYDVRVIPATCAGAEDACVFASPPLRIATQRWGDVTPPFQDRSPGVTSASEPTILDVTVVIDRVKQLPTSALKPIVQLWSMGNGVDLDLDVSVLDITLAIDTVKRRSYPFFGPCDCPASVPCPLLDRCGRCVPQ
jgi:Metallo-peptidase family M12